MVYGVTTVINSSQGQIKRDCRAHINYKWFDNVGIKPFMTDWKIAIDQSFANWPQDDL